jgi:mobilome CxxCx(11)CxxC protein
MTIPPEKRRRCNDYALQCYGTAYIFEKRTSKIRWKLNVLTFLGIAVPATGGAVIGIFSLSPQHINYILFPAGFLGIILFVLSIWSLVAKWNDNFFYYLESKSSNYRLSDDWAQLANTTTLSNGEFETKIQILEAESQLRSDLDNRHDISEKEKRMGMRAGLRKFQRPCAVCGEIPKSMKPTQCGVCGK